MKTELARQLRADEGERACVYKDSLGLWSIAVGRLVDPSVPGCGLRADEITYLLNNDIDTRIEALTRALPWFQNLDDARKGVLLNMSFMGVSKLLKFPHMLEAVRVGDWNQAAAEILDSLYAKQVGQRAERLAQQMKTGAWVFA